MPIQSFSVCQRKQTVCLKDGNSKSRQYDRILSRVLIKNLQEILFLFVSGVKVHTVHLKAQCSIMEIEVDSYLETSE